MPGQMFLRTALTEGRIEELEKTVERITRHLGLGPNGEQPNEPPKPAMSDEEWEAAAPVVKPVAKPKGKAARA